MFLSLSHAVTLSCHDFSLEVQACKMLALMEVENFQQPCSSVASISKLCHWITNMLFMKRDNLMLINPRIMMGRSRSERSGSSAFLTRGRWKNMLLARTATCASRSSPAPKRNRKTANLCRRYLTSSISRKGTLQFSSSLYCHQKSLK